MWFLNGGIHCCENPHQEEWADIKTFLDVNESPVWRCLLNAQGKPSFLFLLSWSLCSYCSNAAIHILQAGNSSNVKAFLGFLFHRVTSLYSVTLTHNHTPSIHALSGLICFAFLSALCNIPHVQGGRVVVRCCWSLQPVETVHTGWQICHEGVEVLGWLVLLSGLSIVFNTST